MNNTQTGTQYYPPLRNQVTPRRVGRAVHIPTYHQPSVMRGDALAAAQLRAQSRQAEIAAMAERDRAALEQKDQIEKARREAAVISQQAKEAAAFNALTTKTNSDWNLHMAKQREAAGRPTIEIQEKVPGMTLPVTRKVTADEFQKIKTQAQIDALTKERSGLSPKPSLLNPLGWFGLAHGDSARIGEIDKKLEALNQPPADLLQSNDMIQPGVVAAPAPKPRGFIGTPGGANYFLESNPSGLSNEQLDIYAENKNRTDPMRREAIPNELQPNDPLLQYPVAEEGGALVQPATTKKRYKYNPETGDFE